MEQFQNLLENIPDVYSMLQGNETKKTKERQQASKKAYKQALKAKASKKEK